MSRSLNTRVDSRPQSPTRRHSKGPRRGSTRHHMDCCSLTTTQRTWNQRAATAGTRKQCRAPPTWWHDHDLLITPSTFQLAWPLGGEPGPRELGPLAAPFSLSGQPSLSLPLHHERGLPVGVQIVGRPGSDPPLAPPRPRPPTTHELDRTSPTESETGVLTPLRQHEGRRPRQPKSMTCANVGELSQRLKVRARVGPRQRRRPRRLGCRMPVMRKELRRVETSG